MDRKSAVKSARAGWKKKLSLPLSLLTTITTGCREPADLIVYNADIHTVDSTVPRATSFAVREGRFVAVGDSERVVSSFTSDAILNAGGATVLPGLIDSHGHLLNEGLMRMNVDLVGTRSFDEIIERLRARARELPAGAWLNGRGWDQNDWEIKRFPVRQTLDEAFPDRPIWIERIDGHATLVNTAALLEIGLDRVQAMPDPPGGSIVRDPDGMPTGLFIDTAEDLVADAVPPPSAAGLLDAVRRGNHEAVRFGLTGVHDPGLKLDTLLVYHEAARSGLLDVRVYAMIRGVGSAFERWCREKRPFDDHEKLTVRAVKLYADGALGSRGAALLEPYSDDPGNTGLLRKSPDELAADVRSIAECGLQPAVHAIGDRAVRAVLDAYEQLGTLRRDLRPRVEHAQIIHPDDVARFGHLGVVAAMQPTHATSDMYWAEDRLGRERLAGAYAWRSLLDSGARLAFGSDFPVETVNPIAGFHAAITRQDSEGWPEGGWLPEQRVTREEALRGFTIDAAYAAFMEEDTGSITVGKLADFVVLDQDIMAVPVDRILATRVLATYVGGVKVYEAADPQ